MNSCRWLHGWFAPMMAISICVLPLSAGAEPETVNGTHNVTTVPNGTFYNLPGDKTTFNAQGKGLYVAPGSTITGLEVSQTANPANHVTGNGGWIHFNAPGQVVRIDGNVNVSALMKNGAYAGNGGKFTVNSAYLYQNGQVYANGINGGHVQYNVASLTMGPNAKIEAKGHGGNGGTVLLGNEASKGVMDFAQGAIVDTSGKMVGHYDTNLIKIKGGLINIEGLLIANGINAKTGNGQGGGIFLVTRGETTPINTLALQETPYMSDVRASLIARDKTLRTTLDGWIRIGTQGKLLVNGANGSKSSDGGNGGLIDILARCGFANRGTLQANGGHGGDGKALLDKLSGGHGGQGGVINLIYGNDLVNLETGEIAANGGNGGAGGDASAMLMLPDCTYPNGGDGGNGGNGGLISSQGFLTPIGMAKATTQSGQAGTGGAANPQAEAGKSGTSGEVGQKNHQATAHCDMGCYGAPTPTPTPSPTQTPAPTPTPTPSPSPTPTPTPAPAPTPTPAPAPTPAPSPAPEPQMRQSKNTSDVNGLHQERRPVFREPIERQTPPVMIALGQRKMFLAKTYASVTQEILNLALREYTRLRALGRPSGEASREAKILLTRTGVDESVALALLEEIQAGKFKASAIVLAMLQEISQPSSSNRGPEPTP